MKVNNVTRIYRPMREFGRLLKEVFSPDDRSAFWVRVPSNMESKEQKDVFIYKTIELLTNKIKINK